MNPDAFHYLDKLRRLLSPLPGIKDGVSYGTPAFYVDKKLIARLKEDGETLVVYTQDRDSCIEADPANFFYTQHYQNYPWVLVRLRSIRAPDLKKILFQAWMDRASKKLIKEWKARDPEDPA
jgi:hypothetical protein